MDLTKIESWKKLGEKKKGNKNPPLTLSPSSPSQSKIDDLRLVDLDYLLYLLILES
jgi:hypothetical protein